MLYTLVYDFLVYLSEFVLNILSYFNVKIKKILVGRQQSINRILAYNHKPKDKNIWIHASSKGEYEQALPLAQHLKKKGFNIFVSFFSPSGFEQIQKSKNVDCYFYLLADTRANMNSILDIIKPKCLVFVRYDLWYHLIKNSYKRSIPIVLISALFDKGDRFFQWYGGFFRFMIKKMALISVQNEESKQHLAKIFPAQNIILGGDTRFDRVVDLSHTSIDIEDEKKLLNFINHRFTIILGSTLQYDEYLFKQVYEQLNHENICWIIVLHEIDDKKIRYIKKLYGNITLHKEGKDTSESKSQNCYVVNTYGLLSRIYRYADMAYIGGGFKKSGLHNVLEPSVYGIPVLIGKYYHKFYEVKELLQLETCYSCNHVDDMLSKINHFMAHPKAREEIKLKLNTYFKSKKGADKVVTKAILDLTNKSLCF